jgi:hypothetical protein
VGKLLDAVAAEKPTVRCRIALLLEELPKDIAADLAVLLDKPITDVGHLTLSRALGKLTPPVNVSDGVIRKHRSGDCSCGRTS